MRICDHWSTEPPRPYFEPLKLLNFDVNADPDPALHSDAENMKTNLKGRTVVSETWRYDTL
jgi:hypothetical protein